MIKYVLEAIPVYWMHLWILLGNIEKIRKICFNFLWSVSLEKQGLAWISWKNLARPKVYGGRGLKIPAIFSKALDAKCA